MSRLEPQPYCFEYERRVEFAETDMAGIVHFSYFYRYMEITEHAFIRSLGHSVHEKVDGVSVGWPRVQSSCDFFKPIRFEEKITIRLTIQEIRGRSMRYLFYFFKDSDSGEELVASGRLVTASVKFDRKTGGIKSIEIPSALRAKFEAAQQSQRL